MNSTAWWPIMESRSASNSEMVEVDHSSRTAVIADNKEETRKSLHYDLLHAVPPQSASDWLKRTPPADPASPAGYVEVGNATM